LYVIHGKFPMPSNPAFLAGARLLASLLVILLSACAATQVRAATPATTGEQTTAVILVNFSDNQAQPKSVADSHALVFGEVSDYLWETPITAPSSAATRSAGSRCQSRPACATPTRS